MNLRRILKPVSAAVLAVGLLTVGATPAEAAPASRPTVSTNDTGWGFK